MVPSPLHEYNGDDGFPGAREETTTCPLPHPRHPGFSPPKPQSHCRLESVIPGRGRRANDRNQIARSEAGARGTEGASRVKLPAPGRCASAGHRSRAMTGRRGKAGGGEGGWGTAFPVFLRPWRGIPELRRRRRGSRVVPRLPRPPHPRRVPSAAPSVRPLPPRAEGSAGLPPRSPALSRVLCRPFSGGGEGEGGGGAGGIAAIERRENPARARQAVESHGHIKMPY